MCVCVCIPVVNILPKNEIILSREQEHTIPGIPGSALIYLFFRYNFSYSQKALIIFQATQNAPNRNIGSQPDLCVYFILFGGISNIKGKRIPFMFISIRMNMI